MRKTMTSGAVMASGEPIYDYTELRLSALERAARKLTGDARARALVTALDLCLAADIKPPRWLALEWRAIFARWLRTTGSFDEALGHRRLTPAALKRGRLNTDLVAIIAHEHAKAAEAGRAVDYDELAERLRGFGIHVGKTKLDELWRSLGPRASAKQTRRSAASAKIKKVGLR